MPEVATLIRKSNGAGFFAIDRQTWPCICNLGMNPAVAYLVLGCGSGRDNRISAWSVHAIETYTGVSRGRARTAIEALTRANFIKRLSMESGRPRYELRRVGARSRAKEDSRQIWLPNALVTGAAGELTPLERVRQTQDVMTLRLLVDLYDGQDLVEEGGVSRRYIWQKYERKKIGHRGFYDVWGFRAPCLWVRWNDFLDCHRSGDVATERAGDVLFGRLQALADLGLIQWVPCLFEGDGDSAEPIHTYFWDSDIELERQLAAAAHDAAEHMLGAVAQIQADRAEIDGAGDYLLAPVPKHIANVQMMGIARLRYRPHTSLTAGWWAELNEKGRRFITGYENAMAPRTDKTSLASLGIWSDKVANGE